jgi:hypothetical protein
MTRQGAAATSRLFALIMVAAIAPRRVAQTEDIADAKICFRSSGQRKEAQCPRSSRRRPESR